MTRRQILQATALVPALITRARAASTNPLGKRGIGAGPAGFGQRLRANSKANPPVDFIDYCHELGLGGLEMRLPSTDPEAVKQLRQKLESYNMRAILDIPLPRTEADLAA